MKLLFVCVHNAGRSVMAEAFCRALAPAVECESAGTEPSSGPHPEVVETMREVGIDVAGHRGRLLTDEMVQAAGRVVTMGCAVDADACPAIRYRDVEDWGLEDPKGRGPDEVRAIRDQVRERVARLLAEVKS